jgi:hypothetical protein
MSWFRVTVAVLIRSITLAGLTQGAAYLYAESHPEDDGLGTGLTAMALLVGMAAVWGLIDGLRRTLPELCVTWVVVGLVTAVATTLFADLPHGPVDWTVILADLRDGLGFWAALVYVPAIGCGLAPALTHRPRPFG